MYIGLGYVTNKLIEYGFDSALRFTAQIEEVRKGGRYFVLIIFVICREREREREKRKRKFYLNFHSFEKRRSEVQKYFSRTKKGYFSSPLCVWIMQKAILSSFKCKLVKP